MNDNDYSDFIGFSQSPRIVAMPEWYKNKDEEKREEDKVQDPVVEQPVTKVEGVEPAVSVPAGNAAGTGQVNGQPVAARTDIGGSMQNMNEMAVKQSAGGGMDPDFWNRGFDGKPVAVSEFDGEWRGKRSGNGGVDQTGGSGVTDPNAVRTEGSPATELQGTGQVQNEGQVQAGGNGQAGGDGQTGEGNGQPVAARTGGDATGGDDGTPADAGGTEAEVAEGQGDYPQTWDEFMKKMKEMDENYRKGENRRNWWELMTRGLVGAANLYGTTKGAPALDLSDSKEAFSNKDAYARLKDEKQTMYNVVNKEIERRQKAEAAALKAKDLEEKWKASDAKVKRLDEEWQKKSEKYDADIRLAEQRHETELAKSLKAEKDAELAAFKMEKAAETYRLEERKKEADIAKTEAATWKIYNGGSGGSKSGNKGGRIDTNGRSYYFGTGADWCGIADDAGAPKSVCKDRNKAKRWIAKNINNPKVKQYIK